MNNSKYGDISNNLKENIDLLKKLTSGSADLVIREITVNGIKCAAVAAEGMVNSFYYSSIITDNLYDDASGKSYSPQELFDHIYGHKVISPDEKIFYTIDDLFIFIYSGFGVILVDGVSSGISFGVQGFSFRSVNTPTTDANIKGSKEGFTEAIKINQTLIRRRIKSPDLVFEPIRMGSNSKTDCALVYMNDYVPKKMLDTIRKKLNNADIDMVLESGSIKMLLTTKPLSLFSEIGTTERPDTLAKKLYEGKIGIMIDGTPFVIIVPFLFAEHFHSLDDFAYKAIYSNCIRFLKFSAFVISFLLPGLYVAVATFHTHILAGPMENKIMEAEQTMPYPFLLEAVLIHFAYEIMREAGLRLPKEIGHAVSIVGGLIIGDAAVSAGIVSAPMVIVAALASISAFVVPALMDSLVMLRFLLIFLGGFFGMYGIALGIILVCVNICAKTVFGIPYSSSVSPTSARSFASFLYKSPKQQFASPKVPKVFEMPGSSSITDTEEDDMSLSKPLMVLLSLAAFAAAGFSAWVLVLFTSRMILPDHNIILLPIPMLVLTILCKNCSKPGCDRVLMLFLFFLSLGAALLSFSFIIDGLTLETLAASMIKEKYLFVFLLGDLIITILFLPFCFKKNIKSFGALILLELLSLLVILEMTASAMIGLLSFSVLFVAALVFVKLTYAANIINTTVNMFRKEQKNLKPQICTAIFILGWVFMFI
ncbi:MAG: spore germination protein [Clostridiales bacterium]|nr:spore germination protein [Clostridiales bacterium]